MSRKGIQHSPVTLTLEDIDRDGRFDAYDLAVASEVFGIPLRRPLRSRCNCLLRKDDEASADIKPAE